MTAATVTWFGERARRRRRGEALSRFILHHWGAWMWIATLLAGGHTRAAEKRLSDHTLAVLSPTSRRRHTSWCLMLSPPYGEETEEWTAV